MASTLCYNSQKVLVRNIEIIKGLMVLFYYQWLGLNMNSCLLMLE